MIFPGTPSTRELSARLLVTDELREIMHPLPILMFVDTLDPIPNIEKSPMLILLPRQQPGAR